MSLDIQIVSTKKEENDFIELPWDLHSRDDNWVPPLKISVKNTLNPVKNPFFKHALVCKWIAYKDGKRVGRIAAFLDSRHNEFHNEKTAHFGFFESIDDQAVANALIQVASDWTKEQGSDILRGPMNPSTNHTCGMQISAFDTKPYVMMTQNPNYYPTLMEQAGLVKAKDLYAWIIDKKCQRHDRLLKLAKAKEESEGIQIRHLNLKDYHNEIESLYTVYHDAWEKNWEFVPMNHEEFCFMANEMKSFVIPSLSYIVEVKGEVAAFSLFLPDLNQVCYKIKDGKLFPTGLLKFIYYAKMKKIMTQGRIPILGVRKKFQPMGLSSMMFMRLFVEAAAKGILAVECSWILEDNKAMNNWLKLMDAKMYKTYRIFEKQL